MDTTYILTVHNDEDGIGASLHPTLEDLYETARKDYLSDTDIKEDDIPAIIEGLNGLPQFAWEVQEVDLATYKHVMVQPAAPHTGFPPDMELSFTTTSYRNSMPSLEECEVRLHAANADKAVLSFNENYCQIELTEADARDIINQFNAIQRAPQAKSYGVPGLSHTWKWDPFDVEYDIDLADELEQIVEWLTIWLERSWRPEQGTEWEW